MSVSVKGCREKTVPVDFLATNLYTFEVRLFLRRQKMKKVSVIIPVYNAGKYLRDCVNSVLEQSYENMEILLIDDGSKDGSLEICGEFAENHENIQVIRQAGGGAGKARNLGMKHATGEWLVFVDADDLLAGKDAVSILAETIERKEADLVVGNYLRLWDGELMEANRHGFTDRTDTSTLNYRFEGFFSGGVLAYVWGKIYRRSFLLEHRIRFREYRYAEDKVFNFECYIQNAKYAFTEENVYIYRRNLDSVSNQYRKNSTGIWMAVAKRVEDVLKYRGLETKYGDLRAHTIFFAAFFDAKQEYEHDGGRISSVRYILKKYAQYPMAKESFWKMAGGKYVTGIRSFFWRLMLRGFSLGMSLHFYTLLSLGIKILIGCKVDERLSSTGKKRFEKKSEK